MWFSGFHNRVILGLLGSVGLFAALAYGGQSSVPITPGSGANFGVVTTATGSDVSMHAVCDGSVGQPCATVNSLNQLLTASAQSGVWSVTTSPSGNTPVTGSVGITGTVATSPTGTTPVSPTGTTNVICLSGCSAPTGGTDIAKWASAPLASGTTWGVAPGTSIVANVNAFVANTAASAVNTTGSVTNTVSTSPTGPTPVTGTVGATQSGNWQVGLGTTPTSLINVFVQSGTISASVVNTVSVSPTGTTPVTGTVSVGNTVTVSTASNTQPVSPTGTTNVICLSGCSAPVGGTDLTKLGSSALGSATVWGVAPTGSNVLNVNANVLNANANGQAAMANSSPVAIASDQSTIPVSTTVIVPTNITKWFNLAVASPTIYGTPPQTGGLVPSVNAFVTSGTVSVVGTVAISPTGTTNVNCLSGCSAPVGGTDITKLGSSSLGSATVWGTAPTGSNVFNANVNCLSGCSAPAGGTDITKWASAALASGTTWGVPPGTSTVGNVNAFVANTAASAVNTFMTSGIASVTVGNVNSNGQATMANSSPVAIASDQNSLSVNVSNTVSVSPTGITNVFVTSGTISVSGGVTVLNANANGQAAMANSSPVAIASNQSTLPVSPTVTTPTSVVGTTPISGIVNIGSGGTATIGSAVPTSAVYNGEQARSSEQTAGANGNLIGLVTDLVGKLIVSPYANKENFFTYAASSTTSSGAAASTLGNVLIPALGAGVYPYITSLSCYITQPNTSQVVTVGFSNAGLTGTIGLSVIYRGIVSGPTSQNGMLNVSFPVPLGGVSMGALNSNTQVVYKGTDGGTLPGGLIGCQASGYRGT